MVYVLVERGYLKRDAVTDELTLTNRLFEIGMRAPRTRELTEVALPAMERLCDISGQSAHLVVINNGETVVIACAAGQSDINFSLRLGCRRPALAATSGRIIIAFKDNARRAQMIRECRTTSGKLVQTVRCRKMFDAIVQQGCLMAESYDTVGVTDIGAPILGRQGHALASITIPYLDRHGVKPRHDHILELLRVTCQFISVALQ